MKNLLGGLLILCTMSFMGCTGHSCCHKHVCECTTCDCAETGFCTCKQNGMACQCKNPCCNCANGGKCICAHK